MKWHDWMPWSSFSECWALSQLVHSPLTLSSSGSLVLHFLPKGGVICISMIIDISLEILIPACASFTVFLMMYSAYKLKKQGDNIQPWRTPVPIWNPSVVPCPVLTEDITSVSLQWVIIFLLVEGLAWKLLDGDWSGGGCWRLGLVWQFLKTRQWWSLIYWLALPFMNNLSVACSAIWQHFTHSRTSFKIGVSSLKLGLPL